MEFRKHPRGPWSVLIGFRFSKNICMIIGVFLPNKLGSSLGGVICLHDDAECNISYSLLIKINLFAWWIEWICLIAQISKKKKKKKGSA